MNNKLRVGLIGAGYLGSIHAKLLATQKDNIDWVGIYDLDAERAEKVAAEYDTRGIVKVEELIAQSDAVLISSATSSHYEMGKLALSSGKHVFLEKPITTTPAEAEELLEIAKKKSLKVQVGHVERFNRAFRSLGDQHPKPKFVEAHRLTQFRPRGTDVAVVLDLMIHDLDLILHMVGEYPLQIDASGVAVISTGVDIANARLSFPSGCVANVTASRISANPMRKLRMFAQDSYIALDFAAGSTQIFRLARAGEEHVPGTLSLGQIEQGAVQRHILMSTPTASDGNAILMEQQTFFQAIASNGKPPVTGEDGLAALRLATEILQKIGATEVATGRDEG